MLRTRPVSILHALIVAAGLSAGCTQAPPIAAAQVNQNTNSPYATLSTLRVTHSQGIATVSVSNPPINVLDVELMTDLGRLLGVLEADADIRVVVFESDVDGFFMARADLNLLDRLKTLEGPSTEISPFHGLMEAYKRSSKITIAKIDGIARGAGSEFSLALDMRFVSEDALIGQPEISFGLQPGGGGLIRLSEQMGRGRALEAVLTGRDFSGAEAAKYGWVNKAMPADQLDAYVGQVAKRIAAYDGAALRRAKAAFIAVEDTSGPQRMLTDFDAFVASVQDENTQATIEQFLALGPDDVARETILYETVAGLKVEQ